MITIESESGTFEYSDGDVWQAAGDYAASAAGFDGDDPCWDPFTFTVDGEEFLAELESVTGSGCGTISVQNSAGESRLFDQDGFEED